MNPSFISAKVYRNYLNLLLKMIDLPTTIQLSLDGLEPKEHTVFHRMLLVNYNCTDGIFIPALKVSSFIAMKTTEPLPDVHYYLVDPEVEFIDKQFFWAGSPIKLFKDYSPMFDKKYGKLSWCASYERDLNFPTFVINENMVLMEATYELSILDLLEASEISKPKAIFVGSVDEDGNVTPVSANLSLVSNMTMNDGPHDIAPLNAVPSFLENR